MAAYNRAGFNLSAFNVDTEAGEIISLAATGAENIMASVGFAAENYIFVSLNERVENESNSTSAFYFSGSSLENVMGDFFGVKTVLLEKELSEIVDSVADLAQIVQFDKTLSESVSTELMAYAVLHYLSEALESVAASAWIGREIRSSVEGFELASFSGDAEASEIYVCNIAVSLAPGEHLVIDSNNYNVMVNGENAIWTQSGDWLDSLNRNTLNIEITSSSGASGITANIMTTEKYL